MTDSPVITRHRERNKPDAGSRWTPREDALILDLGTRNSQISWDMAHDLFPGKTANQVKERWSKVLNPALQRGFWTSAEDDAIRQYVRDHGAKSWATIANLLPGRMGKQCRERWYNVLDPSLAKHPWTSDEDSILRRLHETMGGQWSKIAHMLPGRSPNGVKNRWNSVLARRPPPPVESSKPPLPSISSLINALPVSQTG
jgi:hypothetical protein